MQLNGFSFVEGGGSTLGLDVAGNGKTSKLTASGPTRVSLSGTLQVTTIGSPAAWNLLHRPILGVSTLTGKFANIVSPRPIGYSVSYGATSVTLTAGRGRATALRVPLGIAFPAQPGAYPRQPVSRRSQPSPRAGRQRAGNNQSSLGRLFAGVACQRCTTWRTSLLRSNWSRLKLSSASTGAPTLAATFGSHLWEPRLVDLEGRRGPSVAQPPTRRPSRRGLAPSRFVTTGPCPPGPIALAISLVVVVFRFVPETSTTCLPAESRTRANGSIARTAWPSTTEPEPRPVAVEGAPRPPPPLQRGASANRKLMGGQATASHRPCRRAPAPQGTARARQGTSSGRLATEQHPSGAGRRGFARCGTDRAARRPVRPPRVPGRK